MEIVSNQSIESMVIVGGGGGEREEDFNKLSKKQLVLKCQDRGLNKYKSKNKSELINMLTQSNTCVVQNNFNKEVCIPKVYNSTIDIKNVCGMEYLKTINNNSIDLILTDPPYIISKESGMNNALYKNNEENENINVKTEEEWEEYKIQNNLDTDVHKDKYIKYGSIYGKKYGVKNQHKNWDSEFNMETLDQFICEYYKKLKKCGTLIMFFDLWKINDLKTMLEKYKFKQIRFIEWIKTNPQSRNNSQVNYLTNCREIALIGVKEGSPTFNSSYDNGIYHFPIIEPCGKNRFHPTQKSLNLFEELIKKHSNENDIVLDTFLGSGTTALACKNTNRHFKGCEISEEYYTKIMEIV